MRNGHTQFAGLRALRLAIAALMLVGAASGGAWAQSNANTAKPPILIGEMGSFRAGGKVLTDPANPNKTLSCDHGHVDYLIPHQPRAVSLFMWHSSSTAVWQNRWDGGEGYQSIFLRRGYPVYLWDGPRVGRGNWSCAPIAYTPSYRDHENFAAWRFGVTYPNWFPGVQFPTTDAAAWEQATRARYDEFDTLANALLEAEAAGKALDRIGPSVALTNSAGGWRAMMARLKSDNLVGIVAYETPGFIFPEGEGPAPNPSGPYGPHSVPLKEFMRLTQIPIQLVFGDNTDKRPIWAASLKTARQFAEIANAHGGQVDVLVLTDVGLTGNTHIPMADLNNERVADLLSDWLRRKGLDRPRKGND